MKRKDLYNYIKEEIVSALTESTIDVSNPGALTDPQKQTLITKARSTTKNPKLGTADDPVDFVEEGDLDEMANIVSIIKIQDPTKFALAKEIYTAGRTGALLTALEAAGDEGMTQKQLGDALGLKNDSELNPIISGLRVAGVLTPKREKTVKPEKSTPEEEPTLTPDEEPVDTYFKGDEEETPEEEPAAVSDKEVEKVVGKTYADLSPEEETLFNTFKTAIINKAKVLNDKKSSAADKAKAKAAIDSYKTKDNVKKVFTKKGLKLIDFINGELNK